MKNKIVNIALKNDLKEILANPSNHGEVTKGNMSGFSIEVEVKEPLSFGSYTYYENETLRDADFEILLQLIKDNPIKA